MSSKAKAYVLLLDNSDLSIDGDFTPNRLVAQTASAERLSSFIFNTNPKNVVALGTMGSKEFGIRMSFTSNVTKISAALQNVSSGGQIQITRGINAALLAFHFCIGIKDKRILLYIGSPNDLTCEEAAILAAQAKHEGVLIEVIIIGSSVTNTKALKRLNLSDSRGFFKIIKKSETMLSDDVLLAFLPTKAKRAINRIRDPERCDQDSYSKIGKQTLCEPSLAAENPPPNILPPLRAQDESHQKYNSARKSK